MALVPANEQGSLFEPISWLGVDSVHERPNRISDWRLNGYQLHPGR